MFHPKVDLVYKSTKLDLVHKSTQNSMHPRAYGSPFIYEGAT
jgi:hypothetical protein